MTLSDTKSKSFLQSFLWIAFILLAMGLVFAGVAIVVQLVPIDPESITVTVNGVRRPGTPDDAKLFRLVFLLSFGLVGMGLLAAGLVVIIRNAMRRALERRLRESGESVTAVITDMEASGLNAHISYGNRILSRLLCSCPINGTTYLFKSGILRRNPVPWLPGGEVTVYYDPENIRRYFVDVDGSIRKHADIVEL